MLWKTEIQELLDALAEAPDEFPISHTGSTLMTAVAMALRTAYALGQDAASVWQPIDTAPKDATKIDLWMQIHASPRSMGWADSFRVPEAWWQESTRQWVHLHEGKAQPLYTEYVTHWMPLPAAPRGGGYV